MSCIKESRNRQETPIDDVVTIVAVQFCSTSDKERNYATCERLIRTSISNRSTQSPVALVCLPECFFFIGETPAQSFDAADCIAHSPIIKRYCELARELDIWLSLGGFQERGYLFDRDADCEPTVRRITNAHVVISPTGELNPASVYRKIHLFDAPVSNLFESASTAPGGDLVVVDMGFARVGLTICFDLRFPQMFQSLRYEPHLLADIILVPSAFTVKTGQAHWSTLLRARAIENQVMVVAAAQAGIHNSRRASYGHTMAVDAWGTIVGECHEEDEGFCYAEFSRVFQQSIRDGMPVKDNFDYRHAVNKST